MARWFGFSASIALVGCVSEGETAAPIVAECDDPLALDLPDGSCIRPGVPPDGCAEGFEHDGGHGCNPVLPGEPCPLGLMAVPGETECRPVMPCGSGRWGDIPVDATTQYVDGAYAGGSSDGSEARPWTTIGAAIAAAPAGGLVAVARGTYNEDLSISFKAVRLWGVCPDEVAIVGTGADPVGACPPGALCLAWTSGTEVHGVTLTGAAAGLVVSGAAALLEQVRVYDAGYEGIHLEDLGGPTSLIVRGSLVENNRAKGIISMGSDITIESSVIRGTAPEPSNQSGGRGINMQDCSVEQGCFSAARSHLLVRGSLIENNHEIGIYVTGADATVEASVVRNTLPQASDQAAGIGIDVELGCVGPYVDPFCDPTMRASATIVGSVLQHNQTMGVMVMSSDLTLESSVIRATWPQASDKTYGLGLSVSRLCYPTSAGGTACDPMRGSATLRGSLVEQSHAYGVGVSSSDITLESSVVRATSPASSGSSGTGIVVQPSCVVGAAGQIVCDSAARSSMTARGLLVDGSHTVGVYIVGSDANLEASIVRSTLAQVADGLYGDGIAVASYGGAQGAATLSAVRIDDSARGGVTSFGALVSLGTTRIQCAGFALSGMDYDGRTFTFDDRGDNACGCPSADEPCKVVTPELEPPPLPGSQ